MLGTYDNRIYLNQIALQQKEREFERIAGDLSRIYRLLGETGESSTADFIEEVELRARSDADEIEALIEVLRQRKSVELGKKSDSSPALVETLRLDIGKVSQQIAQLKDEISAAEFAMEDSKEFISELKKNLRQIDAGYVTREALGFLAFAFCPACYAPLDEMQDDTQCHLCKRSTEGGTGRTGYIRARNEIEMQIKECDQLIAFKHQKREEALTTLAKLETLREGLRSEYQALVSGFVSEIDSELEQAIAQRGYKRKELEEIGRRKDRLRFIQDLYDRKENLNAEIFALKVQIERFNQEADRRRRRVVALVQEHTSYLLKRDIKSEAEFADDPEVNFSFLDDYISVNGKASFSASSLTVLRNSLHLGLFWASTLDRQMNYPRYLMMDNVEDKGMTEERSHNFQGLIIEVSEKSKMEHQVIFTTSMIAPELNDSDLVVGEYYTFENKSLKI